MLFVHVDELLTLMLDWFVDPNDEAIVLNM